MKYLLLMRRIYKDGRKGVWTIVSENDNKENAEKDKAVSCNVLSDWEFHIAEVPS